MLLFDAHSNQGFNAGGSSYAAHAQSSHNWQISFYAGASS